MKKRVLFATMAALLAFAMLGLAGCKNDAEDEKTQTVLKVSGIPTGVTIGVAALMDDAGMQNETPTAAGLYDNGTFLLFNPATFANWYGTGDYFVTLSRNADPDNPGDTYIYMPNPQSQQPSKFTFAKGANTIEWGKFVLKPTN